jgi:hypothetical protein
MKKLLSILGAIGIIASSSTTVVSCHKTQIPTLNGFYYKKKDEHIMVGQLKELMFHWISDKYQDENYEDYYANSYISDSSDQQIMDSTPVGDPGTGYYIHYNTSDGAKYVLSTFIWVTDDSYTWDDETYIKGEITWDWRTQGICLLNLHIPSGENDLHKVMDQAIREYILWYGWNVSGNSSEQEWVWSESDDYEMSNLRIGVSQFYGDDHLAEYNDNKLNIELDIPYTMELKITNKNGDAFEDFKQAGGTGGVTSGNIAVQFTKN